MNRLTKTSVILFGALLPWVTFGQGFSSGSDGSDGALEVTENMTLPLPPDGILHFTTVSVEADTTLTFARNELNTPVYLLATGDITIAGTVSVSGRDGTSNPPVGGEGGPGGFDGGLPGFISVAPGAGYGPGAGQGGQAWFGAASNAGAAAYGGPPSRNDVTNNGAVYGSPVLVPILGGSGGGGATGSPGVGGGGGGGAILISSSTQIHITGNVLADGASSVNGGGSGSGGAIRLVSPRVSGTGGLRVRGGTWGQIGGHGRIRVDTIERRDLRYTFDPLAAANVGSFMAVFPTPVPRLDIIEAAGTAIAEGTGEPVTIQLPFGSDPNRTVTVQARDFDASVPIRVVLTPDSGLPIIYDDEIDNSAANPASKVIDVTLPVNVRIHVGAWTR